MAERFKTIDSLRGIAMLVMILTHTTVFFPHDKFASFLWNWSHFSVVIFLFCSLYLFLQKYDEKSVDISSYLTKRVVRLLLPYYLFLFFFLPTLFFISPNTLTVSYILKSILLIGGVDINWLVLLFLCLTIIAPILTFVRKSYEGVFWFYFILSGGATIALLFFSPHIQYRWIMWLPWSVLFYFTVFYRQYTKKYVSIMVGISLAVFVLTYTIQVFSHHDLLLINNKYPPNIYYLSYGMTILLLLSVVLRYKLNKTIGMVLDFFSFYSYEIFFIHYILLTIIAVFIKQLAFNWVSFFLLVLFGTVGVQLLVNTVRKKLYKRA